MNVLSRGEAARVARETVHIELSLSLKSASDLGGALPGKSIRGARPLRLCLRAEGAQGIGGGSHAPGPGGHRGPVALHGPRGRGGGAQAYKVKRQLLSQPGVCT